VRCYAGVRKEEDFKKWQDKANVVPLYLDVTDKEQIDAAVGTVLLDLKQNNVDLVAIVNNAGIGIAGPVECLPASEVRRQFDVNVFGGIQVVNAFMPLLRNSKFYKRSRIVWISSIAGAIPGFPFLGIFQCNYNF
jgi:NAD(P)-dependent dehydrogenase (short-subunit alcohol dehydrogenase family)